MSMEKPHILMVIPRESDKSRISVCVHDTPDAVLIALVAMAIAITW